MRHKGRVPQGGERRVERRAEHRAVGGGSGERDVSHGSAGSAGSVSTADPWIFAGRDSELQFIAERIAGAQPRSVVIVGPAGAGKTRLAREAVAAAGRSGRTTRWTAGTSAAAAIPLGAFAHLLPAIAATSDPLVLLQTAGSAIADGSGQQLIIGIDDAHLLDELSVSLLHQLALTGAARLVVTVRTGEAAPDLLVTLWKDGLADRLELPPLPRAEVDRLVTGVLGGVVDSRTSERLWRASRGNALFLRELVEGGCQTDRLRKQHGVWRWEGRMEPTPRLHEIVQAQLGGLSSDERAVLELLATSEPLHLGRLAELTTPEAVAALERRGLVTMESSGWWARASLAHPIYGAVVRDQLPEADACQLRRRLAHAHLPWQRHDDLVRAGALLLDSDEPGTHAGLLADAAQRANLLFDHDLAVRLARAAIDGGAGLRAQLALQEALRWRGHPDEAERVAAAVAPVATAEPDRYRLVVVRAVNLCLGLGQVEAAETMLQKIAAESVAAEGADHGEDADHGAGSAHGEAGRSAYAIRGVLAFYAGRPRRAAEFGQHVLTIDRLGTGTRVWASGAAAVGLAACGRTAEALATVVRGRTALEQCGAEPEIALAWLTLAHGELSALLFAGRIREAETRAAQLHTWCMAQPAWAGDAVAAVHVGWSALAAGRPRTAVRWLIEATAGLGRRDPGGYRQLCVALLAQAHALLGDATAARRVLDSAGPRPPAAFIAETLLAQAWVAAADNQIHSSADRALQAASVAAEQSQQVLQAQALHTVVRLGQAGAEVTGRLRELAEQIDGSLVATYRAHAEAAETGVGESLDEVAAEFAAMGARLLATEAAAQAAAAHERAGARRRAAASTARAANLARDCEMVRTPVFDQLAPPPLTSREDEVAGLVVQGLNNQAIAEKLVLSVRTVEAHLAHAYAKLGIRSRAELAGALGRPPAHPPVAHPPAHSLARPSAWQEDTSGLSMR